MKSTIVQACLSDMQYLLDGARSEGWNPGLNDATPFYFTDPSGFFIEKLEKKTIGCISAVAYNKTYGFMGFYIVEPEYRHKGYGIKLWNHAIDYLGNRTIGLDGVIAQQNNYRKSGFEFHYNNIRFGGKAKGKSNRSLLTLNSVNFNTLVDYDSKIIGFDRSTFLQHWITLPNSYSLAKFEGQNLVGYGLIRKCIKGYKMGPLFADSQIIADEIYTGLMAHIEDEDIFIDIVQTNSNAINLASNHGLKILGETARMYKGSPPKQNLQSIYGVTTLEIG